MSKVIAVLIAGIAVVSTIGLASGLAPAPVEPRMPTESRQPETSTTVQEDPAAAVISSWQGDPETTAARERFRETKDIMTSATVAYYQGDASNGGVRRQTSH